MKQYILIIILMLSTLTVFSQNERKFVRKGNELYEEALKDTTRLDTSKFSQAETEYRRALNKKPGNEKWEFNLSNSLYKQMRFEESEQKFSELQEKLETPEEKARALHNLGNSQLMQKKIDESIESYKKALRKNPNDIETKYNLAYAQNLKKKQEQQQQQQQQNQDQNKNQDKNKDQQQNKDQQNQDKNQDKKDQDQQQQQNQQNKDQQKQDQQQQQQQQQNKISKQDAEQLLQALQNDEKKIQDKVKKAKAVKAKKSNVEKEW